MPDIVYLIGENHVDLDKPDRELTAYRRFKPDVISLELTEPTPKEDLIKFDELIAKATRSNNCSVSDFHKNRLHYNALISVFGGFDHTARRYVKEHPATRIRYIDTKGEWYIRRFAERVQLRQFEESDIMRLLLRKPSERKIETSVILLNGMYRALLTDEEASEESSSLLIDEKLTPKLEEKLTDGTSIQDISMCFLLADACYCCDPTPVHEEEFDDLEERDRETVQNLLSLDGRIIVHKGGLAHIFGNYNNVYAQLKEKKVEVKRFKLNRFTRFPNAAQKSEYLSGVKYFVELAEKMKYEFEHEENPSLNL